MKAILLSLFLLPLCMSAQDFRVITPEEIIPGALYIYNRPIDAYLHRDGSSVCAAYITVVSTGEVVRIAMLHEDCGSFIEGDILTFEEPWPPYTAP